MRSKYLNFIKYDEDFLNKSYTWLNDVEINKMTDAGKIDINSQMIWFDSLKLRSDYKIWGVVYNNVKIGAVGIKKINYDNGDGEYFGYIGEKAYWGMGIGSDMMDFAIEKSIELGLKKIVLHVNPWNCRAVHLYEKKGFSIIEQESTNELLMYKINL